MSIACGGLVFVFIFCLQIPVAHQARIVQPQAMLNEVDEVSLNMF